MLVEVAEGRVVVQVGRGPDVHTSEDAQRAGLWAVRQAMGVLQRAEQQLQNPKGEPFIRVAHTKG